MECPKCARTLRATKVREVEVDRCKRCRGIWCDRGELTELLGQSNWRLAKLTGSRAREELNLRKGKCPRDGCDLVRISCSFNQAVVLDTCPQCQGIWLDGGELDKLLGTVD